MASPSVPTSSPGAAEQAAARTDWRKRLRIVGASASRFRAGEPLKIELALEKGNAQSVRLHSRHVNQAERWKSTPMERKQVGYLAEIPADYTHSAYPLQYYFVLRNARQAWFYPALNGTISNQPYYAIFKRS